MAQRTDRKVSPQVANLPEKAGAEKTTPGVYKDMSIGTGDPSDHSAGNDGKKG